MSKTSTCKCVKSKCLQLYCECYRRGVTCADDCVCIDCRNTAERAARRGGKKDDYENARTNGHGGDAEAAGNPVKIRHRLLLSHKRGSRELTMTKMQHGSGCSCPNSRCVKKYCVCYSAGVECSAGRCKCSDCVNPHGASKTAVGESGLTGARTLAKVEVMRIHSDVFKTSKKKTGSGCSCTKNKCITKYCDCNSRGVGCDPAVCSCVNCENMMKPLSEVQEHEHQRDDEDETEVYAPTGLDVGCKVKGLENWFHLIDDFEDRRISVPSEKVSAAYAARESAADAAMKVIEEESKARSALEKEIEQLEGQLEGKVESESRALEEYLQRTNRVMCLEMEEPCRWNDTYRRLKEYVMRNGDLPPAPSACANEPDRRLSIWVQEMKSLVYSKSERMTTAPHRVEALEALGVEWVESSEARWNRMHDRLAAYKKQHGTAQLPPFMQCRRSKDKDLIALRHWVDSQEAGVESGAMSMTKLRKLQALGLPLKLTWKQEWDHHIVELLKFRSKHGHLILAGNGNSDLSEFVTELLDRLKKGGDVNLTADENNELRSKGLLWDLKNLLKNPSARRPTAGGHTNSVKLVPLERVKEVNYWAGMLDQLRAYQAEHNTLDFPPPKGVGSDEGGGNYEHLRDWVEAQRKSYKNKTLEETRVKSLAMLGLAFDPWEATFHKLRKFKKQGGTARLPKVCRSDGTAEGDELEDLCKWVQEQIKLYRKDELDPEKKKKLRKLGVQMTKGHMGKVSWEHRFDEMMDFYHSNKTCLPQKEGPLREWVLELVELIQTGFVSFRRQKMIDKSKIGPYLRPEVIFKGSMPAVSKKRKTAASWDDLRNQNKRAKTEDVIFTAV